MKKTTFFLHDIANILGVSEKRLHYALQFREIYPQEEIVTNNRRTYSKRYFTKEQLEIIKTLPI
jgi:DNA-binding transcriptional MerR regulator